MLFEKYGPRLNLEQLAEVLDSSVNTFYNQLAAGTFPIPTYKEGTKRFADVRDVATYLDERREEAKA